MSQNEIDTQRNVASQSGIETHVMLASQKAIDIQRGSASHLIDETHCLVASRMNRETHYMDTSQWSNEIQIELAWCLF
jgi:hypothetical protein